MGECSQRLDTSRDHLLGHRSRIAGIDDLDIAMSFGVVLLFSVPLVMVVLMFVRRND